jgi:hypothetical protein
MVSSPAVFAKPGQAENSGTFASIRTEFKDLLISILSKVVAVALWK